MGGGRGFSTLSALSSKSSAPTSNNENMEAVKIYFNADKDKIFIYKDNRNKSGIYC